MAEPFTWVSCISALATAIAGPVMRACSEHVFPRLETFLNNLFQGQPNQPSPPSQPNLPTQPTQPSQSNQPNPPSLPSQPNLPTQPSQSNQPNLPSSSSTPNPPNPPDLPYSGQIIIARDLKIEHLDNKYWALINYPNEPRFKEVAVLLQVWFFYIEASMNFLGLSANTKYRAYLIFSTKPERETKGLNAILKVSFSAGTENGEKYVCLKPTASTPSRDRVEPPKDRLDGWMELELAEFSCDKVTGDKEASICIKDETEGKNEKMGLIIAGIEFRPV